MFDAFEQRRGDEDETRTRLRQAIVDLSPERLADQDVLLAEPDRHAFGFEQVVQLRPNTEPVIPRMSEEEVAKFGLVTAQLDRAAIGVNARTRSGV